ncbi:hypothetical protein E4V51_20290 [Paenibacillus sp. 28ISP30-2]|nr:hypothetical protein [Paenibacillus sp. 28ISP30-2]
MNIETSLLARQHLEYAKQHPEEVRSFNTLYDHFYYYLTFVNRLTPSAARIIVEDFESDMQRQ